MKGIVQNIDNQIKALNESIPLHKPDPHAGNILVDPVIIACLVFYWKKLKVELGQGE